MTDSWDTMIVNRFSRVQQIAMQGYHGFKNDDLFSPLTVSARISRVKLQNDDNRQELEHGLKRGLV